MMRKSIITTRKQAAQQKRGLRPLKEDTITKSMVKRKRGRKKNSEYHPGKLKRDSITKKVVLKPKHEMTVVGNLNKRKFSEPRKGVPKQPKSRDSFSMKELILEDNISLSEEDFLEILNCPSPVWWEESEDECYFDEPITPQKRPSSPAPFTEQKTTKKEENPIQEIQLEKYDKKFIDKRSTLESIMNNIKTKIKNKKGIYHSTRDSKGRFKRKPLVRSRKQKKYNDELNNDSTDKNDNTDCSDVFDSDISDEFYGFRHDSIDDSVNRDKNELANLCNMIKSEINDELRKNSESDEVINDNSSLSSFNSNNDIEIENLELNMESHDTSIIQNCDSITQDRNNDFDKNIVKEELNDTQVLNDNIINDETILFDNIKVEEPKIDYVDVKLENDEKETNKHDLNDDCYENVEYLDLDDYDDSEYTKNNDIMDYLLKSDTNNDNNEVTVKAESLDDEAKYLEHESLINDDSNETLVSDSNENINDNSEFINNDSNQNINHDSENVDNSNHDLTENINNDSCEDMIIDNSEHINNDINDKADATKKVMESRETFTKIDLRQAYLSLTQDIR